MTCQHDHATCDACGEGLTALTAPATPDDSLDVDTMADVLTEAHLRRDGICRGSHRDEAEFVVQRYADRLRAEGSSKPPEPQP